METLKFRAVLLMFTVSMTSTLGQEIVMRATHICQEYQGNQMKLMLRTYEQLDFGTKLEAIDDLNRTISTCFITGTGLLEDPFEVDITVNLDFYSEDNRCGLQRDGPIMKWRFLALGQATQRNGVILNVKCDLNNLSNGRVETLVEVEVDRFIVRATNPLDVTGDNSVATGAELSYEVNVIPGSPDTPSDLQDALGIYVYSCYSSTNKNMVPREMFIDSNGCPVTSAVYRPATSFKAVSNGDILTLIAENGIATIVQNKREIYFTCLIGKCTQAGDSFYIDRCSAYLNGETTSAVRIDTGIEISTSLIIQDRDAQVLEARDLSDKAVSFVNDGTPFRLVSYHTPGGIGGIPALEAAAGFYLSNCTYSLNGSMNNAVQFIGDDGCVIPGTELSPASPPVYDVSSSSPNVYVLKSGLIIPDISDNRRYTIWCDTGMCLDSNHNHCRFGKCGQNDNIPGATVELGFLGQELTMSVLSVLNLPAINIVVLDEDGNPVNQNNGPTVGQEIDFKVVVTPGGQGQGGSAFQTAKGIYIYNCFVFPIDNPLDRTYVVGAKGCQVPDSPYQLTERCMDTMPDLYDPPFEISCGKMIIPEAGNLRYNCSIGVCETEGEMACRNRCEAGDVDNLSGVSEPDGLSATSAPFQSNFPEVISNERTAIKSEEIQNTIIAVCVVGAIVLLVIVSVGTCLIVKSQKARAKQSEDSRSYNYQ